MNGKKCMFGIAMILFAVIFIFVGCQLQPVETGNGSRDGAFEKDSLLIEVWDQSTPPKFMGYDTGLRQYSDDSRPIILTSKGYCVQLRTSSFYNDLGYTDEYGEPAREYITKVSYGKRADMDQGLGHDEWNEILKNNGWGYCVFFATASPTANDTPYALWGSNIINDVIYNPHNGGTYYTEDRNATVPTNITMQANFKFYDATGTIHTLNDDDVKAGEQMWKGTASVLIGRTEYFIPLKKIGGYAELGLPDPATVTPYWTYKVR